MDDAYVVPPCECSEAGFTVEHHTPVDCALFTVEQSGFHDKHAKALAFEVRRMHKVFDFGQNLGPTYLTALENVAEAANIARHHREQGLAALWMALDALAAEVSADD